MNKKMKELENLLKIETGINSHSPSNLAKSISIEANELLECFQWDEDSYDIDAVKEELVDVLVYC